MAGQATPEQQAERHAEQNFTARLYRLGINFCVDVPTEVSAALGGGKYIAARGTVSGTGDGSGGGQPLLTRLVPRGGGEHRLFLNGAIRRAAGLSEGDEVTVTLSLDGERRDPPCPDDLAAALAEIEGAGETFEALSTAMRTEMLTWLAAAKRDATRAVRIERIVTEMHDRSWQSRN